MTDIDTDPVVERFRSAYASTPDDAAAVARTRAALHRRRSRSPIRFGWVLAAAAVCGLAVILRPDPRAGAASSGSAPLVTVRFELSAHAERVSVVGDFNGWDPAATPMVREGAADRWQANAPVGLGRSEYAFVLDGKTWIPDPAAPVSRSDAFGARNSVLTIRPGGAL